MSWVVDFVLLTATLVTGFLALRVKDLLAAVVALSAYSFFMALLYTVFGAVDVGFTEAVIGAGITGVLFVAAIFVLGRRAAD
ncbi:MAG: DUF4040 domain-containing protein [Candidatus Eisenbacteria bacterium]|uniref:DUF4040 domain-containing protein n=1 Tax=Eiseniibacteriota bacterium TaxID=2212470 RepID=A0A948RXF4_UNCEI|nr:DUF4040 domain-containing protein [Candidatus Eisenbacteria bacterium]MBU1947470.1 DUF4040 domain-containing protein [Candidatus Eisenbacteria bacterium]MBU2690837.1 DUF4040 domain-containing protein [Candidatus Eisenbacteria bacterium]